MRVAVGNTRAMLRLPITVSAALLVLGCGAEKRGIAGASCSASSDCEASLQCVSNVCVDVDQLKAVAKTMEDAANAKADEDRRAREELVAALKQLKEQQDKIQSEKAELEGKLDKVTDEAERASLIAQIQAKDAELAANAAKMRSRANVDTKPVLEVKNTPDPLDGL